MQSSCCVHLEDQEYHVKSLISTKVLSFTNYQNDHLMLLLDNQYTTHCNQFDMRKKNTVRFYNRKDIHRETRTN